MLKSFAEEICAFLQGIPGVNSTEIIGSLAKGNFDKYSDIDIEVDVSGMDNGQFLIEIPKLLAEKYDIVYCDFAPAWHRTSILCLLRRISPILLDLWIFPVWQRLIAQPLPSRNSRA